MFSKLKKLFSGKIILSCLILFSVLGFIIVKAAWLDVDPMQVVPPDSFIKPGIVLTLIEEDEKYYLKKEYFSNVGTYEAPASEQQISYEDYSLMRNNGSYDILEKRNRHIINDVYVDEYYKAYSDGEIMAGNYVAEVLDGYFVPIDYPDGHRPEQVGFINDGGIFYKVTKFLDANGNYTKSANYFLLSQYEYEQEKLNIKYDFEEIVEWDISDDGNTITKTISYYDIDENYLMRPIVLQLTGFDNLQEYINPDDIDPTPKPTETPSVSPSVSPTSPIVSPTLVIITPAPSISVVPTASPSVTPSVTVSPTVSETPTEAPWAGIQVELADYGGLFENIVSELSNSANGPSDSLGNLTDPNMTPQVVQGIYDDAGNFIKIDGDGNIVPSEDGIFDADGNFTPNEGSGYYDSECVWHPTELIPGVYDEEGNFITDEGVYDENGNFIPDGGNEETPIQGYIDENGNLIMPDGTIVDNQGIVHLDGVTSQLIDNNGFEKINPFGKLTLDFNGNMIIWDKEGHYDENGLFYDTDGNVGYFDSYGRFTKSRINPFEKGSNGFYDVNGDFHSFNTIYRTENDTLQLILMPDLGITVSSGLVTIPDSSYSFSTNGIVTKDGITGYFNSNGDFLKSDRNAYKGGFFDEKGRWIDDFLIKIDKTQSASLSYGYYDKYGVFTTPNNDRGYFNENGKFIINRENPYPSGYYDWNGDLTNFGKIYYDLLGNVHKTGSDEIITTDGSVLIAESEKGIIDKNNNWFKLGDVITPEGRIGHYNEFAEYEDGQIPYADGYYDADGNFFRYDGIVILADGTVGYFDENGIFHEGVLNGIMDSNGNYILPDGTVITPDGLIGYYDENGIFHEGENPYINGYFDENGVWHSLNEEGYVDKNGNTVLPNGIVLTPEGAMGYYDENGNFVELDDGSGLPEGAWIDENGVIHLADGTLIYPDGTKILPDGTVILPDGTVGYYDENGNFIEELPEGAWIDENGIIHLADGTLIYPDGTVVLPDGTTILPDGTIIPANVDELGIPYEGGYYDENGVWHSFDELPEGAYIDANGNLVMPDGTVITPDGLIGYYDENGVWHEGENPYEGGYYDENGVWHANGYYDANGNYVMSDGTIVQPDGTVILPDGTVVYGYIDENGNLVTENISGDGYYDESGNLLNGENLNTNGFYDADGNYYLVGDDGYYDENGTYHGADGLTGYYDENGVWHEGENPYINGFYDENGIWHGGAEEAEAMGYYDENGVWHEGENPYEGGYYDENGVWHDNSELGYTDINGNTVLPNGVVLNENGVAGYYDENGIWHEGENPYEGGYYDENGVWHDLETDSNGNIVLPDGTIIGPNGEIIGVMGTVEYENTEPMISYYDENGTLQYGTENPYEGGYYDANGNWHSLDGDAWIDSNGNAHVQTEGIGYYDADGNFHLYGQEGYYDENGNFHAADGTVGYYDENGVFHPGENNPYPDGYYDAEGNWHPYGETGYFDENGVWHEDVTNDVIGYYDENGVWHEGNNPYVNGYYDENGIWHGDGEPLKAYYDANGELQYGDSPYQDGWYDANGNFHPYDSDGYFDSTGTYHTKDGVIGYYDADGIFHEGTNPNLYGYYDAEGNYHPAGDTGYYDVNGTYHSSDGGIGYYDENGEWHNGQENPYEGGWYDANGNFHPYDEDGWYDADGVFHSYTYTVARYNHLDNSYIYFTGHWRTATENAQFRLSGNSVQFTINKKALNKIYSDTGIFVGLNSILEYEEAADILHMIAISTGNEFVQDNEACILIYNGRMITLTRDDKITVRTLQKIFENTNIDITIRKTRLGRKYALVDAIESNSDIKLKFGEKITTPENPLLVIDNEAYVALNDVAEFISYDYSIKPAGKERKITLKLKKSIPHEELRGYMAENITFITNEGKVNYNDKNGKNITEYYSKVRPTLVTLDNGYTTTYIPIKMVPRFTGSNASFNTKKQFIDFSFEDGLPIIQSFYDVSEPLEGDNGVSKMQTNADGSPVTINSSGEVIEKTKIEGQNLDITNIDDEDYGELFGEEALGRMNGIE